MCYESFESGILPQTLREASLSLILKKNKDPSCCESYCPVSLLNVKILANVLALRLEPLLSQIISPDQIGFMRNRYSFFNIRQLFNISYHHSDSPPPEILMSMDDEKAFDRLEYLFVNFFLGSNSLAELDYYIPCL